MNTLNRMTFDLRMDRPVITHNDMLPFAAQWIDIDGFTIETKEGERKSFDFYKTSWNRSENDHNTIHISLDGVDTTEFGQDNERNKTILSQDFNDCKWLQFMINTGEDEAPEIYPEKISKLMLEFIDDNRTDGKLRMKRFYCPKWVVDQINNDCILPQTKRGLMEAHMYENEYI